LGRPLTSPSLASVASFILRQADEFGGGLEDKEIGFVKSFTRLVNSRAETNTTARSRRCGNEQAKEIQAAHKARHHSQGHRGSSSNGVPEIFRGAIIYGWCALGREDTMQNGFVESVSDRLRDECLNPLARQP
jgi:hypothetical protein